MQDICYDNIIRHFKEVLPRISIEKVTFYWKKCIIYSITDLKNRSNNVIDEFTLPSNCYQVDYDDEEDSDDEEVEIEERSS